MYRAAHVYEFELFTPIEHVPNVPLREIGTTKYIQNIPKT